jgi:hypothetical protein
MSEDYLEVTQPMDYDDFFDDIDGAIVDPIKICVDCDKGFHTNGLLVTVL